jgi:hypothetical protein
MTIRLGDVVSHKSDIPSDKLCQSQFLERDILEVHQEEHERNKFHKNLMDLIATMV